MDAPTMIWIFDYDSFIDAIWAMIISWLIVYHEVYQPGDSHGRK